MKIIFTKEDAMQEYKEWYDAHSESNFMGNGNIAIATQDELRLVISDKEFLEKYDLRSIEFQCYKNVPCDDGEGKKKQKMIQDFSAMERINKTLIKGWDEFVYIKTKLKYKIPDPIYEIKDGKLQNIW